MTPKSEHQGHKCVNFNKASNGLAGNLGALKHGQEGEQEDGPQRDVSSLIKNDATRPQGAGTRPSAQDPSNSATAVSSLQDIQTAVRTILKSIGEDPTRPGLIDTPKRFAEAMMVFTEGYGKDISEIVNGAIFDENHHEMVIVKDIVIASLCEHHLVPFTGKMHIGYIPDHHVIGLSKLPRIAEVYSRRLQVQERLTSQVADTIMEVLNPLGVAVMMESSHLCMVTRGVQKPGALTVTSCVRGCFKTDDKTRNEFFHLVGRNA